MAQNDFIEVTLQGTTYQIPKADANPAWGEQLQDYLEALANAFSTVVGPADIKETTAVIANNQVSAANITGLVFDSATVRAAIIEYTVYRSTNSSVEKETGVLIFSFDSTQSSGNKWAFSRQSVSDSGVIITVTDGGQAQYTSDNMSGSSYNGIITFRARGILQD